MRSDFKLVQLLNTEGGPADEPTMRYAEMATFSGLEDIKEYADIIGAYPTNSARRWIAYFISSKSQSVDCLHA